jgi:NAD(P)-dependent dehydrogenase (short-subunit alcohol dehydrogenase family)
MATEIDPEYLLDVSHVERVLKPDCLAGRRALVTGARFCSIGSATALALQACGAEIAIHAESDDVLDPTCRFLDEKDISYDRYLADFSRPEEAEALGHRVLEDSGPIDILVNVAGVTLPTDIRDVTIEQYQRIHNINCTSAVMLTKSVLPGMLEARKGNIVLFSSIGACLPLPGHYFAYAMSKAAMEPLAHYLAVSYGPQGITTHTIVPGVVDNERHRQDPDLFATIKNDTDNQPVGYMATPIEVGANVALLCTDLGRYANGSALVMDGGRLKKF